MNTGASQFNHPGTQRLKDLKLKLLRAVITQMRRRVMAGLQAVGANDSGGGQMFNNEVIANGVERVLIQSGRVGLFKPFVEFKIKDLKTQGLGSANVIHVSGQPCRIASWRTYEQTDGLNCCFHGA